MRAQRKDDGTEKVCSCGAAVKQSCEKEGKVTNLPSQDSGAFLAAGKVLGDFRSSALGVPERNSSGKRLPGAGQALALPGKIPGSCQPSPGLHGAGEAQQPQPKTREPSLLPQATQAAMDPDQMNADSAGTPKRSCTHQEEQV